MSILDKNLQEEMPPILVHEFCVNYANSLDAKRLSNQNEVFDVLSDFTMLISKKILLLKIINTISQLEML